MIAHASILYGDIHYILPCNRMLPVAFLHEHMHESQHPILTVVQIGKNNALFHMAWPNFNKPDKIPNGLILGCMLYNV